MDGRLREDPERTGIEMPDGAALLREVLVVIGVESRIPLRRHLVAGDEVEVLDGEETGTETVTMITGGYHHLEGIATLHLPGVVDVEVSGGGRKTRDLAVHPAETPDTIERAVGSDDMRRGVLLYAMFTCRGRLYSNI